MADGIVYLNLSANNQNSVSGGSAIKFDSVFVSPQGIMYMEADNTVLIMEDGIYFVSWWVSVKKGSGSNYYSTTLRNKNDDILASAELSLAPSARITEVTLSGNGLLQLKQGDMIRLVNSGGDFNLVRENGYSGVMTINKIPDTGVYAAVTGGDMGIGQGDIIKGDKVQFQSNVMYEDGVFTVMEKGQYFVAWHVNFSEGRIVVGNLQFAFNLIRRGATLLTSGINGIPGVFAGLVQGGGIIQLDAGDKIGIYNVSDTELDLNSSQGLASSISIFKI